MDDSGPLYPFVPNLFETLRRLHEWCEELRKATNDEERRVIIEEMDKLIGR